MAIELLAEQIENGTIPEMGGMRFDEPGVGLLNRGAALLIGQWIFFELAKEFVVEAKRPFDEFLISCF